MRGCTRCGACCLLVALSPSAGCPTIPGSSACALLTEEMTCSVYDSRPDACRVKAWTYEMDEACDTLYRQLWELEREGSP